MELLFNGTPLLMLEAKKLGTPSEQAIEQVIGYCIQDGIDYFAVTDGNSWSIYETHRRGDLNEKRIIRFNVMESQTDALVRVLKLWQRGISHDDERWHDAFRAIRHSFGKEYALQARQSAAQSRAVNRPPNPPPSSSSSEDLNWKSLSGLNPPPKNVGVPPIEILFPDGSSKRLIAWNSIPIEITRWLVINGHLNASHCPIQRPRGRTRYILNYESIHPTGRNFEEPKQVEGLYLDVDYNGRTLVDNARIIINQVGQDPSQFKVRLASH
ncbi:MAG: hypothetical protein OXG80_04975 [Chloroflexi bacterium]|nr:hypothetical protein [Chloroflexota bacterium]